MTQQERTCSFVYLSIQQFMQLLSLLICYIKGEQYSLTFVDKKKKEEAKR